MTVRKGLFSQVKKDAKRAKKRKQPIMLGTKRNTISRYYKTQKLIIHQKKWRQILSIMSGQKNDFSAQHLLKSQLMSFISIFQKEMISPNNETVKDEVLRSYINEIFNLYDNDHTGHLNANNITHFFNDLFRSVDVNLQLTPQQSYEAIKMVYPNYANQISKDELFLVFKFMLGLSNIPTQPPPQPVINMSQFGGFNPAMLGNPSFMGPAGYFAGNGMQPGYMGQFGQNPNFIMMRPGMNGFPQNGQNGHPQQNGGQQGPNRR